jgi:hypothetical protein
MIFSQFDGYSGRWSEDAGMRKGLAELLSEPLHGRIIPVDKEDGLGAHLDGVG